MTRTAPRPPSAMSLRLAQWRRQIARRRRLVSAALLAIAVAFGVAAVSPPAPPTELALATVRDLTAGHVLSSDDVREVRVAPELLPAQALRPGDEVVGRIVGVPMGGAEILTEPRLLGDRLLAGYEPGTVAAPVRIPDAASVDLLQSGDVIDVLASATDSGPGSGLPAGGLGRGTAGDPLAQVVASAIRVVSVPAPASDDELGGGVDAADSGGLLILAASPEQAARLAQAQVVRRLSVVLRRG